METESLYACVVMVNSDETLCGSILNGWVFLCLFWGLLFLAGNFCPCRIVTSSQESHSIVMAMIMLGTVSVEICHFDSFIDE